MLQVILERWEEAKKGNGVGTVERWRPQLYFETLHYLCNSSFHVIIVVLGPVGQVINAVVQVCLIGRVDRLGEGYRLFQRMETSVAERVDRTKTAVAATLERIFRLVVRYGVTSFQYRYLAAVGMG